MRPALTLLLLLCLLGEPARSGAPQEAKMTFYITGLECPSCVYNVTSSVADVKGISEFKIDSILDGYAIATFDKQKVSAHQVAQAVRDAYPLHGNPYTAALKVLVPDYAKGGNAAKVDAVFAAQKDFIKVLPVDKMKGEFLILFQPLKVDEAKKLPQGWDLEKFRDAIQAPAPKGLGLAFEIMKEGQEPPKP